MEIVWFVIHVGLFMIYVWLVVQQVKESFHHKIM